jgi:hypothetical protein
MLVAVICGASAPRSSPTPRRSSQRRAGRSRTTTHCTGGDVRQERPNDVWEAIEEAIGVTDLEHALYLLRAGKDREGGF